MDRDLRERVLRAAAREPSATRLVRRWRSAAWLTSAGVLVLADFLGWGGLRAEPRPVSLIVETAAGAAIVVSWAGWWLAGRGRSMVGRPLRLLIAVAVAMPLVLLAWKVAVSSADPAMMVEWPERPGFRCLGLGLSLGVGPLLALIALRRREVPHHPSVVGAAMGVAAGGIAWVFTDLWCPVAYVPHLLLGHVLPIALLAATGALLGRWVLALRAAAPPR